MAIGILFGEANSRFTPYRQQYSEQEQEGDLKNKRALREQAESEEAQLLSEYKSAYASQVTDLKQQLTLQGQTDWGKVDYENPIGWRDIEGVGAALLKNGNQLK
ncbi:MAG: hypothetical protein WBY93_23865 [Candidatus Binatus sp.]